MSVTWEILDEWNEKCAASMKKDLVRNCGDANQEDPAVLWRALGLVANIIIALGERERRGDLVYLVPRAVLAAWGDNEEQEAILAQLFGTAKEEAGEEAVN